MGYYSMLNIVKNTAEFKDIPELNEKIKLLDSGSAGITITDKGEIETEDGSYYGKFYDDQQFAELLSEYIVSGRIELAYSNDDGDYPNGFIITPGKVVRTYAVMVPETDDSYDGLKAQLAAAYEKVKAVECLLKDAFLVHIKETYPDDFKKIQAMFDKPITRLYATEYQEENGEWLHVVTIKTETEFKEFAVKESDEWTRLNDDMFIYTHLDAELADYDEVCQILLDFYNDFPFVNTEYC
jgi:hypothetical protein